MRKIYCVVCALALMVCFTLELNAQKKQIIHGDVDFFYKNRQLFNDVQSGNKFYVTLKFEHLPSKTTIQKLNKNGIKLLSFLADRTYLAVLPKSINKLFLQQLDILSIGKLTLEQKMSKSLLEKKYPSWAINSPGTVDLVLVFNETTNPQRINEELEKIGGKILENKRRGGTTILARVDEDKIDILSGSPFLTSVDVVEEPVDKLNNEIRCNHRVNVLQSNIAGGYNLDGAGVVIGVGDGGELGEHIDFDSRVINYASGTYSSFGDHGDHVSGIVGGGGHINYRHKGMAPKSTVLTQKTSLITYYAEDYVNDHGMVLTNNSYGTSFNCDANGTYNYTSQTLDWQMRTFPNLLHLFAAGNSGGETCGNYPTGYKTVLRYYQSAKNVLTVGNMNENRTIGITSSRGPVADGRIKPEILGIGMNVYSTGRDFNYSKKGGTSMSSPAVAGTLGLLYQKYRLNNSGTTPKSGLIKAIACNTADDLGNAGPDYIHGFGIINGRRAANVIENGYFLEDEISNAATNTHTITIPSNTSQLKIMLYWHDKEAEPYATKALVNDLDIIITTPSGTDYLPWVLNPDTLNVGDLAVRAIDTLNNIEQITIDYPEAGSYTITISGTSIPVGPQEYFVTYDLIQPELILTFPFGEESLEPENNHYIQWDADKTNTNDFTAEYSLDGGDNWTLINNNIPADARSLLWTTPAVVSENAKIRISKNGTAISAVNDKPFIILGVPENFTITPKCQGILQLDWDQQPDAESYQVTYYDGEEMKFLGNTSLTTMLVENPQFLLGEKYWFAVSSRTSSGNISQRTIAISAIPTEEGLCPWGNDIRLRKLAMLEKARQATSVGYSVDEPVIIEITNVGNNNINSIEVNYQINGGAIATETYAPSIAPGDSVIYEFTQFVDMYEAGDYNVDVWVNLPGDIHNNNDSIVNEKVLTQLPNTPLPIGYDTPVFENFFSVEGREYTSSVLGVSGLNSWDYNTNGEGKFIANNINNTLTLMPVVSSLSPDYENDLIWNLNLSEYDFSDGNILLSFEYMNDTGTFPTLVSDNKVWVRGSDTSPWLLLTNIVTANASLTSIEDLNLSEVLASNGQVTSTSTQIKIEHNDLFSFTLGGMTIEEIEALPVELLNFTAEKKGINDVLLTWSTAQEINNKQFEVEVAKSESEIVNNEFKTIGKVPGQGTTITTNDYEFLDQSPDKAGHYYYRLKQIDNDGQFEYSPVRLVTFHNIDESVNVYPNPFTNHINVYYETSTESQLEIKLIDGQGRVVQEFEQLVNSGISDIYLPLKKQITAGVYLLKITADKQTTSVHRITNIRL